MISLNNSRTSTKNVWGWDGANPCKPLPLHTHTHTTLCVSNIKHTLTRASQHKHIQAHTHASINTNPHTNARVNTDNLPEQPLTALGLTYKTGGEPRFSPTLYCSSDVTDERLTRWFTNSLKRQARAGVSLQVGSDNMLHVEASHSFDFFRRCMAHNPATASYEDLNFQSFL